MQRGFIGVGLAKQVSLRSGGRWKTAAELNEVSAEHRDLTLCFLERLVALVVGALPGHFTEVIGS